MQTSGNTILITGGGSGIGLALAEVLAQAGNQVIICGRRQDRLDQARGRIPGLQTIRCDLADPNQRQRLAERMAKDFPRLNILVNNAGIQRPIDLLAGADQILAGEDEIEVNLKSPILLTAMLIPLLSRQDPAAVVNITSGLGFVPLVAVPIYCATKAAMHSYSLSLRHQLRQTTIRVFEVVPPTVDTELDHGRRERAHMQDRGIPAQDVATGTLKALTEDVYEAAIGGVDYLRMGARTNPEQVFARMNGG